MLPDKPGKGSNHLFNKSTCYLEGKKRYSTGGKLEKPKIKEGAEAIDIINSVEGLPPAYTSSYYSEFHGNVQRIQFNPKRYDLNLYDKTIHENEEKCVEEALKQFGEFVEVRD